MMKGKKKQPRHERINSEDTRNNMYSNAFCLMIAIILSLSTFYGVWMAL